MAEAGNVWVSILPSLSGFKSKVNAQLKGMGDFTVNVGVNVDSKAAQAKIDEATKDQTVKVEVTADTAKADADLGATDKVASKLDGRKVALTVTANVTKAIAGLATVATAANAIDKRTLSPNINLDTRGILGDLARVGSAVLGVGASITRAAGMFSAFSLAGAAAVKTIGSLGPAVEGAVGAAGLLPSLMLTGAATAGTLAIGLHGVGDAVTNAFDPTKAKQFNEAMAKLSPNAQAAVREIQSLGGQLTALRMDVQDRLFANVSTTIGTLAGNYLPMARAGFGAMATEMNSAVLAFAGWLNMPATIGMLRVATDNVTLGFHNLVSGGAQPFLQALTTIAAVGSAKLPFIANAIAGVAVQFNTFIQQVAASGQLDAFFENATTQVGLLFQVVGHLGQIFISVFSAGAAAGGNLLGSLVGITGQMALFLQSAQGMTLLTSIFQASNAAMAAAQPLIAAIGQALVTSILPALTTTLPAVGAAFGALAPAIAPLGQIIAALAPVLAVVANVVAQVLVVALAALAPIVQALAPLFIQWALAIGGQLVGAIQTLSPLLLALATFMGQHPALVMGVVGALGALAGGWTLLRTIVGALLTPLTLIRVGMLLFGVSVSQILGPLFTGASAVGGFIARLSSGFSVMSLGRVVLSALGQGVSFLLRTILGALGPIGMLIAIFGVLFTTNEQFRGAIMQLLGVFGQLISQVIGSLQPAFTAISGVMTTLSGVFGALAAGLATALVPVVNALASVLQFLTPVLVPLIDAIIAIRTAMMLWTAAQWALNIALDANPIGMIVLAIALLVGAVVAAYTHFAWFRDAVNAVWTAISTAATWLWTQIVTIFNAIWSFLSNWGTLILAVFMPFLGIPLLIIQNWGAVSGFFVSAWNTIVTAVQSAWAFLSPIFSAIGTVLAYIGVAIATLLVAPFVIGWNAIVAVATWAWSTILQPIFNFISLGLTVLGLAFSMFWQTYVVPAWNGVVAAAQFAWGIMQAIWYGAIVPALQFVGSIFTWLWVNIAIPVWNGIVAAAQFAWGIMQAIWYGGIVPGLQFVGSIFNWLWQNIAVPVWNGIVAAAQFAWGIMQAIWYGGIVPGLQFVGSIFTWLWQNIVVPVWNGITSAIQGAWQFIQGVFDVGKAAVNAVGQAFQDVADWVARAWDTIKNAARAPIQFVVDVVYNNGIRPVWNGIAGLFGMAQLGPVNMATGGVLPGYAPGRDTVPAMLSRGEGILVPEAVQGLGPAFVGWANRFFSGGRSSGGAGTPGGGGYSRGGIAHFDAGGIVGGIVDWISGAGSAVLDFMTKAFTDPVGAVRDLFSAVVGSNNNVPGAGQPWTEGPKQIVPKTIDAVIQKVKDWIASMASAIGGGAGVQRWAGVAAEALRLAGAPASWLGLLLAQMQTESGGNPAAINLSDSNAAAGHPSQGLMQVIPSTFAAYAGPLRGLGILNPLANIYAAIKYTMARYGSPVGVWGQGHGYDSGGLASGSGLMLKSTIAPERVLSPQQTQAFESLVPLLSQMRRGGVSPYSASDFAGLSARDPRSGATINVYPSERMDETQLAEAALHRLDWQMGLVTS